MKPSIKAFFLDLDGLLVDSEEIWSKADRIFLARFGKVLDPAMKKKVMGKDPDEVTAMYRELFSLPGTVADLSVQRQNVVAELFEKELEPMPGALDFLEEQKRAGKILCLATSSTRSLADVAVKKCGFHGLLDHLVTSSDVDRAKPEPDIYLECLERTGVRRLQAIVLEDSPNGVVAAVRAGIPCIGVADKRYVVPTELQKAGANVVVNSLKQVTERSLHQAVGLATAG